MKSSTMPEERSVSFDPDEEFPWDCDLQAPTEADVAELLDEGDE